MTQDAQNENAQDKSWTQDFCDPDEASESGIDAASGQSPAADNSAAPEQLTVAATDTITGEYWGLDDLQERQDASVCGNSIGTGAYKASGGAYVKAYGQADLLAIGQSRVYGSGHARIAAGQNATVVATEQTKVTASGKVAVCATGSAKVYASDDVIVAAMDRTEVYATGRVKIKAFGSSTVHASGDSEVEVDAQSGCTVHLYGNARQVVVTGG
jgi:hypothetical protein